MQGAFPIGADWSEALDPGNDVATERKKRSDILERELARIAQQRNPGAPPVPPDPLRTYTAGPFPPTTHFRVDGVHFYVLKKGLVNTRARPGRLGHYLVTVVVDELPTAGGAAGVLSPFCRPFLHPTVLNPARPYPDGAPGTTPEDWRAPPNERFCVESRDYIVANPDNPSYWEIGLSTLKESLESGEALDLAFARRLEGLGNVAPQVRVFLRV